MACSIKLNNAETMIKKKTEKEREGESLMDSLMDSI